MRAMKTGQYKTLAAPVEGVLFKERKSKFLGYAYPVNSESQIEQLLIQLKQEHGKANHVCYAWQLGTEPVAWRANDDGEPNNSAGMPIYGQIQAYGITNVLLAVVRYFGGTKLGVGGLVSAYRTTAQHTLEGGEVINKVVLKELVIEFDYKDEHRVMQIIKRHQIEVMSRENTLRARYVLNVPLNRYKKALDQFRNIQGTRTD